MASILPSRPRGTRTTATCTWSRSISGPARRPDAETFRDLARPTPPLARGGRAMGSRSVGFLWTLAIFGALAGCGQRHASELRSVWQGAAATVEPPGTGPAASPLVPVDGSHAGGAIVLARVGERELAFIADEDARAVRVLDAVTHAHVGEVA